MLASLKVRGGGRVFGNDKDDLEDFEGTRG